MRVYGSTHGGAQGHDTAHLDPFNDMVEILALKGDKTRKCKPGNRTKKGTYLAGVRDEKENK